MKEIENTARKYATKNAFEHKGSAQTGAVIGKIKALFPEIDLKKIGPTVSKIISEVNGLDKNELASEYKKFEKEGWELKQVEKEKTLPELTWFKKGDEIITRVAPNPSGAMHFGHARPAILTDEYVRKYGGKLFVRFDDTDPKIKKPLEGIEKEFLSEFSWLDIKVAGISNASNNLKRYYQIIEELIKKEKAYICFCESEKWKALIWKGKECPCRKKSAKEQLENWGKMLKHEIKEGEAIVRIKSDLKQKDTSLIDWWLAKIVDKVEHPNKNAINNHVWPSYNFASAIDDHDMKINFIIRGQEHISNEKKQRQLYEIFNWTYPHTIYHGKVSKVGDMILSKSKIKTLMEKEGLTRDDDPRLATLKSFRRRGFSPIAIRKVITDAAISLKEVKIDLANFAFRNKEVTSEVNNYPFIEEGIECEVIGIREGEVNYYGEKIVLKKPIEKFILDKKEILKFKAGDVIRLKNAFNIKFNEINEFGATANFISFEGSNQPVINWIGVGKEQDASVLMSDGSKKVGLSTRNIKENSGIICFLGLGYVNIEDKNSAINCIFSYK